MMLVKCKTTRGRNLAIAIEQIVSIEEVTNNKESSTLVNGQINVAEPMDSFIDKVLKCRVSMENHIFNG